MDNLRTYEEWKNHLTKRIYFLPSKDSDKNRLMHSKSDN